MSPSGPPGTKRLYSIRIDNYWRGVVLKQDDGDIYTLLTVRGHYDAYEWVSRRSVTVNSATGVIELRDVAALDERTFSSMTGDLLAMRDWLMSEQVSLVGMEATGAYWKPIFYLLDLTLSAGCSTPGTWRRCPDVKPTFLRRRVVVSDGRVRTAAGFVRSAPEPIRQLRDLTRYRTAWRPSAPGRRNGWRRSWRTPGSNCPPWPLTSSAPRGGQCLAALIDGERDVHALPEMAKARMRPKIPQLLEALTGNFGEQHAFLCWLHLQRIDQLSAAIQELSSRVEEQMRQFSRQFDQLETIPGVGQSVAEVIVAETGADMSRFRTAGHLAPWAGICPGHHESAGNANRARPVTAIGGCAEP